MTKPNTGDVTIRHRDTGAIRVLAAKDWKQGEKELRAGGYAPCREDGSPLDGGTDHVDTPDGSHDAGTGSTTHAPRADDKDKR